ncbi:DNA-binding transcriptional response regulator, NtrC family, contains REC, AAA-type ATPase, and a Fis-type DNA-binding domains [Arenibacter palladensis]|uniref:DNA-binding transcriptional response regulator, NtrC family, contains REC, AAA-type ATPase, and a Fis-type DNA-binding domains n=1 Tax=Arenibacter palladensis TaxID=237373 RepID=A0A1M4Z760_9FLAO|nr:sigma-54 dependent transcriptional regulator [Arenibacter palladensis]SHF13899.1 DNA-binding transcriptional response regulator, NtrC family, contains REC, AAA-type ATPase, and a Fis-type DNA-binding domains [Arenibacter palladensis]
MGLNKENVLIVDDDVNILELIHRHLQSFNYHTYKAVSVKEALVILKDSKIDLLITDLKMPDVDGLQLVKYVSEHYPKLPKLVVTGYPSVDDAMSVIKSGALDYLVKPFTKEELKQAVLKSFTGSSLGKVAASGPSVSKNNKVDAYGELIGRSEAIKKVTDIIDRVKDNKATVLINGESGTGKELVARSVHYMGKFSRAPFVAVNCGAIPESLLEAELFGYAKGAFTGANENRNGFFQAADKGTLFLDEIGNASLSVQSKLLRALQEKEVIKVGSQKIEKIDIRVIAATNSNLYSQVQKKLFREDLYYRLTVVEINVPSLRERKEDIPLLVDKFLLKYGVEYKDRLVTIAPEALELLMRYPWPGNIRELENVIQRAVIMCDKRIEIDNLPDNLKFKIDFPEDNLLPLREVEKRYILKVLEATDNNKSKAAEILQIDRKTLRQKIQ